MSIPSDPDERKTGVYVIRNLIDGKEYVGSAMTSFRHRWNEHARKLVNKSHPNYLLRKAWHHCGPSAFRFEIMEFVPACNCLKKEQEWIDALNPEYNIAKIAGAPMAGRKHSAETVARMSAIRIGTSRSAATKAKMSASLMGNQRWLGHKHNGAWYKRMQEVLIGNKFNLGYKH